MSYQLMLSISVFNRGHYLYPLKISVIHEHLFNLGRLEHADVLRDGSTDMIIINSVVCLQTHKILPAHKDVSTLPVIG